MGRLTKQDMGLLQQAIRHHQEGALSEAEFLYRRLLKIDPQEPNTLHLLGVLRLQQGKPEEAVTLIRKALSRHDKMPAFHDNLGLALQALGRVEEAQSSFKRALVLDPDFVQALSHMGLLKKKQKKFDEAFGFFAKAIAVKPSFVEALNNWGNALREVGRAEEAIAKFEAALTNAPSMAELHNNLGAALKEAGRLDEARACFERGRQINSSFAGFAYNLGAMAQEECDFEKALSFYNEALKLSPAFADAKWNRSMVLLMLGQYEEGWKEYEWRWQKRGAFPYVAEGPLWDGTSLEGKTILLHAEQGLGDSLQFIRFAKLVKAKGGSVFVRCQGPLVALFSKLSFIDQIFPLDAVLPSYDCHAPLMSLPYLLGTTLETIPHETPYLFADEEQKAQWREKMEAHKGVLKVGLVWAGSPRKDIPDAHAIDRRRSMTLAQFAPLAGLEGVRFFSLQKDGPSEQAQTPPEGMDLVDYMKAVSSFADTAALIEQLDLVIGVDTSVIHLAGAMGKPVWVLSRFDGCWRWLQEREDSPWYPSLRLFRQKKPGAWDEVVERVRAALASFKRSGAEDAGMVATGDAARRG